MDYSFWLAGRVLLYASSHIQDSIYHGLCYTSRGALAGTRNSSIDPTTHRTMNERSYHRAKSRFPGACMHPCKFKTHYVAVKHLISQRMQTLFSNGVTRVLQLTNREILLFTSRRNVIKSEPEWQDVNAKIGKTSEGNERNKKRNKLKCLSLNKGV